MLQRLFTFVHCPQDGDAPSSVLLANAGFEYIGPGDRVKCGTCLITVDGWKSNGLRSPRHEHRLRSPQCTLALACCSLSDQRDTDNRFERALSSVTVTGSNSTLITTVAHTSRCTVSRSVTDTANNLTRIVNSASSTSLPVAIESVSQIKVTAGSNGHCGTKAKSGPVDCNNPNYDRMKDESNRLMSYVGWPSSAPVQPPDLAADGWFYTGQSDRVFCAFCRGTLHQWVSGDTPAVEHRRHYPECRFVKGLDVGNVPLVSKKQTTTTGKAAMVSGNVERRLAESAAFVGDVLAPEAATAVPNESTLDEEELRLMNENRRLIESRTCKVCMDHPVDTVFLPCGHLVACHQCAPKLRDCPICRTYVRGTVKTFFS